MYFDQYNPNLKLILVGRNRKTGNGHWNSIRQQWTLEFDPTAMDTGIQFNRLKKPKYLSLLSGKFLLFRKFRVDNSECRANNVRKKKFKTFKMKFFLSSHSRL